ncbi:molybdopterin molybdenumtransferase MoeA [Nitratireductor aestuarii]|uniref:Molybdopterin molybdenumtransferase n=1 Tax=Nitratireductor aestuarii TaxID=1735103 RepID=A0A916RFY1_9HYPH|nr:gephyrin-like molybdotransferase Glp [Nitratireductor aestuarii]GGA54480.1 molybdopterin molybdenumtransferase MoeA [Nitratireductor aestuarii]
MSLLAVDEALERILEGVQPLPAETVPLRQAADRVLASPLAALRTHPPFHASAMDGYAVRAADIAEAPASLRVIGTSAAGGSFEGEVLPQTAVRIFTGAPLPKGADTILIQENARVIDGDSIEALQAVDAGRHIRRAGLDFAEGNIVLEQGRILDPAALSLAAAAGHATLPVVRSPLIAIISTGDELVPPGVAPGPNQIVASNNFGIAALAQRDGARILDLGIVPDDREAFASAVRRAREAGADILVTLGGASVGDRDITRDVLAAEGMTLSFWKIAMRPGKPLIFGRFNGTSVLGLPGNPVSSMVCAHVFLSPLVRRLAGRIHAPDLRPAELGAALPANDSRRDYVRASVALGPRGLVATPFPLQDSSMLSVLAAANALIIRAPNAPAAEIGDRCQVLMLR